METTKAFTKKVKISLDERIVTEVEVELPYYSRGTVGLYRAIEKDGEIKCDNISTYPHLGYGSTCEANVFNNSHEIVTEEEWLKAKSDLIAFVNGI